MIFMALILIKLVGDDEGGANWPVPQINFLVMENMLMMRMLLLTVMMKVVRISWHKMYPRDRVDGGVAVAGCSPYVHHSHHHHHCHHCHQYVLMNNQTKSAIRTTDIITSQSQSQYHHHHDFWQKFAHYCNLIPYLWNGLFACQQLASEEGTRREPARTDQ